MPNSLEPLASALTPFDLSVGLYDFFQTNSFSGLVGLLVGLDLSKRPPVLPGLDDGLLAVKAIAVLFDFDLPRTEEDFSGFGWGVQLNLGGPVAESATDNTLGLPGSVDLDLGRLVTGTRWIMCRVRVGV